MSLNITLTPKERLDAFRTINRRSDAIMTYVLIGYFLFGLMLSFFYETWFIAIGAGGFCLAAYFVCRLLLPDSALSHYVMSVVLGLFAAQFIYQMHGLFEMHFFFFVGSTLLVTYRNWKLILPLLIVTVIHHAWFAWLQYSGMKEIYFTQLDYMTLQAFIFHAGLAAVIMGICGFWSYDLGQSVLQDAQKTLILERQVVHVKHNIAFADAISNGNLQVEYNIADTSDELGRSLLQMRNSLRASLVREEEEKFITIGITKVGDIIRQYGHDPVALAEEFIRGLVKYSGLNQGALFVHEGDGDNGHLRLAACYAYDRKKFLERTVGIGEGLVGQCYLEREPIFLTDIPGNYVKITSGLGEAVPKCVFIVPVKTSEAIAGVIELASFNVLRDFEKEFIFRAAENIASAILSSRTTERIKLLLADSEQRTEEMRSQEEEMRQNMEELQATQEEMARKQSEHEERLKVINMSGVFSVEFSTNGQVLHANEAFLRKSGWKLGELQGKNYGDLQPDGEREHAHRSWDDINAGRAVAETFGIMKQSREVLVVSGSFNVLRDAHGTPQKVILLGMDVTALVQPVNEYQTHGNYFSTN